MTHSELTSATTHLYSDDEKRHIEENCRTKGRKRSQGHQHHISGREAKAINTTSVGERPRPSTPHQWERGQGHQHHISGREAKAINITSVGERPRPSTPHQWERGQGHQHHISGREAKATNTTLGGGRGF